MLVKDTQTSGTVTSTVVDEIIFPGGLTSASNSTSNSTSNSNGKKSVSTSKASSSNKINEPNTATLCLFGEEKSLLTLNFNLTKENNEAANKGSNNKASISNTIFVVDVSGSMAGAPFTAVKSALEYIKSTNSDPYVITYNTTTNTGKLSDILPRMTATGGTSFSAALNAISALVTQMTGTISVIFMSDGQDNHAVEQLASAEYKLKVLAAGKDRSIVVSTVGFGQDANLAFLQKLTLLGTVAGYAKFAATGEGAKQLYEKLADLFDVMGSVVNITLSCSSKLLDGRKATANINKNSTTMQDEVSGAKQVIEWESATSELWLNKEETQSLKAVLTSTTTPTFTILTAGGLVTTVPLIEVEATALARLREIETRQPVSLEAVKAIAKELGEIDVFSKKHSIAERAELTQARQLVCERLTEYTKILAEVSIDENVRNAKLRDLNHDFKFSKARRQRKIHERAAVNAARIEDITKSIESLTFTDEEVLETTADSDIFECDLSHSTLLEVMKDSPDDVLGFGLRVSRQEHVIDAPTSLRVESVSSTLISRSSFETAVLYTVEQEGLNAAHGNFGGESGCAFVGRAREPINAFLPMYICGPHAERVKATLEPLLGYLFSLSPFGYDRNQRAALFSVLGTMLLQLPEVKTSRSQLIVDEFGKLCGYLAQTPETLEVVPQDYVTKFINEYGFRTKAEVPNLLTVPGYVFALTSGYDDGKGGAGKGSAKGKKTPKELAVERHLLFSKLLPALFEEAVHRKIMNAFTGAREATFSKLCDIVLGSESTTSSEPVTSTTKCDDKEFKNYFLTNSKSSKAPSITVTHSAFAKRPAAELKAVEPEVDALLKDFEPQFVQTLYSRLEMPYELDKKLKWAALVQSLRFSHNDGVKSAISNGRGKNIETHADEIIRDAADHCNEVLGEKFASDTTAFDRTAIAKNISETSGIEAFAGKLRVYCPNRTNAIFDEIVAKLCLLRAKEKIEALLRNKVGGAKLYDYSAVWSPPARVVFNFRQILGEELFKEIETENKRVGMTGHRYRESDKPNRHGFCNSNPNPLLMRGFTGYEVYRGDAALN